MTSTPSPADLELALAPMPQADTYSLALRFALADGADDRRARPTTVTIDATRLLALDRGSPDYGLALRDALFADPSALAMFGEARAASLAAGRALHIRLALPDALQPLCWEALVDPRSARPLALEADLLLSRYISRADWGEARLRRRDRLRALVAVAGPADLPRYGLAAIDVGRELALAAGGLAGVAVDQLPAEGRPCSLDQLRQRLFAGDGYDIVYLVAHGSAGGAGPTLYLEGSGGGVEPTPAQRLVDLLRTLLERRPALVVLASCESAGDGHAGASAALGPRIAEAGVPAVLAMQGRLSFETAGRFMPAFFQELMRDGVPDRAAAVARGAVRERPDWWAPVIYTRLRGGSIWREPQPAGAPRPAVAAPAGPPSYSTLPPLPGLVVGREDQLRRLKGRLGVGPGGRSGRPAPITTIHGFPGQGKTTIALALGYDEEVRRAFPGGVLWADLGESPQVNLHGELARWGDSLQTGRVREAADAAEAIRRMSALLQEREALLIVDDVWQKEHGAAFARARGSCPLIITTRAAEIAGYVADHSDDQIRLPGLDAEAGLELLGRLAPAVVRRFEGECRRLVAAVEGLPLALQVAGRMLHETHALVDVRRRIEELIDGKLLEADLPYQLVRETNNTTVAALLRRSIDYLDPETRERFIILGAFVAKPATFDPSDIAAAWATDDPGPTVDRLIRRGLLEPASTQEPSYQMHALLADMARALLDDLYL